MYEECHPDRGVDRRNFFRYCGGMALLTGTTMRGSQAPAEEDAGPARELLPTIALGEHRVTRLIAGYNPIGGHSHTTLNMARHMREYFTVEQTAEFLLHCERQGINAWQYDHTEKVQQAIRRAREQGCGLQLICLHAERAHDASLEEVMRSQPIAVVHHGGVTDALFRAGQAQKVHDFVKKVHDSGALAGVSAHNPENIQRIADEGWENDLFMTCLYYVTRPREEMLQELGKVTVGEPFFESDPDDMTAVIRSVNQPCLAFKILAAGRKCWSRASVDQAFQYALSHIKATDAVIVGMFPRYTDEVAEGAELTRKYGRVSTTPG